MLVKIAEMAVFAYFAFAAVYFAFFAAASFFYREHPTTASLRKYRVTVLIPAYKEDAVIVETARECVAHASKCAILETVVIADSLQTETIKSLVSCGARVIAVQNAVSTKTRSIRKALEEIDIKTDYVVILDADNIMDVGCVDNLIGQMEGRYRIVQGHRTAKNANTRIALLDGLSEEVNNAIFREGHRAAGFPASLIGSGFICEYGLMRSLMDKAEAVGGFDKELELKLLEQNITIGYARGAVIRDEKVQQAQAFTSQRRRWLAAQWFYLRTNAANGIAQLVMHGNVDYFDKLLQFFLPPRALALGITVMFTLIHILLFAFGGQALSLIGWATVFAITSAAIAASIPRSNYRREMLGSLSALPMGILLMAKSLFQIKGANNRFIHTQHGIAAGH